MPEYHNLKKFKNRKVLGLKFHKKIQWVPHAINSRPDLQAFRGGCKAYYNRLLVVGCYR